MKEFGSKKSFCFVVGIEKSGDFREIDIWANNKHLTATDNMAYLPQFTASLARECEILKSTHIPRDYIFLNLGPTTDDFCARIEEVKGLAHISFILDNEKFNIHVSISELRAIYAGVVAFLQAGA